MSNRQWHLEKIWTCLPFGLAYVTFNLIYWGAGGTDPWGNNNWRRHPKAEVIFFSRTSLRVWCYWLGESPRRCCSDPHHWSSCLSTHTPFYLGCVHGSRLGSQETVPDNNTNNPSQRSKWCNKHCLYSISINALKVMLILISWDIYQMLGGQIKSKPLFKTQTHNDPLQPNSFGHKF